MDMNTLLRARTLSLEDITTENFSPDMSNDESSSIQSEENPKSKRTHSYRRSNSSTGSYVVDYGPIRIRHRRSVSQTLATGRRSKDEQVEGEEAIKRELRRAKNRKAARELKITRDKIESDLIEKIKELEQEKASLQDEHKELENRKAKLNRALYNAKQAPLIPFIADMNIPILFELQQRHDILIDFQPLLKTIDEQFCLSDH